MRFELFKEYRGLRRGNYILFLGRTVTNLGSLAGALLTMILNLKLGMDASRIAKWLLAMGILQGVALLVGGRLADRFNKRNIIICCDLASILSYVALAALPLTVRTLPLMGVAGAMQTVEFPSYDALVADITPTRDRARAYSLNYLGVNLGLMLAPTIGGLLFENWLWLAFLISGIAIGCSTLLIFTQLRDITPYEAPADERSAYEERRDGTGVLKVLLAHPVFFLFMCLLALWGVIYEQAYYLFPLDLSAAHGEKGALIMGTITSFNCLVAVLFTPLLTRIFRRAGEPLKILLGFILLSAGIVTLRLSIGRVTMYYVGMYIFTLGEIMQVLGRAPYMANRIPASHRGRMSGITNLVGGSAPVLAPLLLGGIYDNRGSMSAWFLVFGICALSLLLALFFIGADKRAFPDIGGKQNC